MTGKVDPAPLPARPQPGTGPFPDPVLNLVAEWIATGQEWEKEPDCSDERNNQYSTRRYEIECDVGKTPARTLAGIEAKLRMFGFWQLTDLGIHPDFGEIVEAARREGGDSPWWRCYASALDDLQRMIADDVPSWLDAAKREGYQVTVQRDVEDKSTLSGYWVSPPECGPA